MNLLDAKSYLQLLEDWQASDPLRRQQLIAVHIFGLNVDPRFAKIVEPKETGGIRLINMPEWTALDKAKDKVKEAMKKRGWDITTSQHPRSTRVTAFAICDRLKAEVDSPMMPENDAICFAALAAIRLEIEIASREAGNA